MAIEIRVQHVDGFNQPRPVLLGEYIPSSETAYTGLFKLDTAKMMAIVGERYGVKVAILAHSGEAYAQNDQGDELVPSGYVYVEYTQGQLNSITAFFTAVDAALREHTELLK